MWSPNSLPYWKSNSSWPDFSAGMASLSPCLRASSGTSPPNCSSTSTPAVEASRPRSTAFSIPSNTRRLASVIVAVSSAVGSPSIPNIFFWNEPLWSKARMYSLPSYPSAMVRHPCSKVVSPVGPLLYAADGAEVHRPQLHDRDRGGADDPRLGAVGAGQRDRGGGRGGRRKRAP